MKKKTQEKILQKSQKLMTQSVRVNMLNQYERVFSLEYGIDAKAFCNYFKAYYQGGDLTTCCRLIRQKHCSLMGLVMLKIPTKHDPKNSIKIQINSQNDLKRNAGINSLKFTHQYRINRWITMKNTYQHKQDGWANSYNFGFSLCDQKLNLGLKNDVSILNGNLV